MPTFEERLSAAETALSELQAAHIEIQLMLKQHPQLPQQTFMQPNTGDDGVTDLIDQAREDGVLK